MAEQTGHSLQWGIMIVHVRPASMARSGEPLRFRYSFHNAPDGAYFEPFNCNDARIAVVCLP